MNQRLRSRKRNVVTGTVARIKKQQQALGVESVGDRVEVITRIIRRRKEHPGNDR